MLITVAASPMYKGKDIANIEQMLDIYADTMGSRQMAKVALTFAVVGACVVAAIVVTLCGAWTLEQALGKKSQQGAADVQGSLLARIRYNVQSRPEYYISYACTCLLAWFLTIAAPKFAEQLTGVWTQFINGLLMPPVIFALWYLSSYSIKEEYRLGAGMKWCLFFLFGVCSVFCIVSIPFAI